MPKLTFVHALSVDWFSNPFINDLSPLGGFQLLLFLQGVGSISSQEKLKIHSQSMNWHPHQLGWPPYPQLLLSLWSHETFLLPSSHLSLHPFPDLGLPAFHVILAEMFIDKIVDWWGEWIDLRIETHSAILMEKKIQRSLIEEYGNVWNFLWLQQDSQWGEVGKLENERSPAWYLSLQAI